MGNLILRLALLLAFIPCYAGTIVCTNADFTGTVQGPRLIYVYYLDAPTSTGTNIITRDRLRFTNDATGYFTITNYYPGNYRFEFQGSYTVTTNYFNFPATNGTITAHDPQWGRGPTNGIVQALTVGAGDARFIRTFGLNQPTNLPSAGQVLGSPDGTNLAYVTQTGGSGSTFSPNANQLATNGNILIIKKDSLQTNNAFWNDNSATTATLNSSNNIVELDFTGHGAGAISASIQLNPLGFSLGTTPLSGGNFSGSAFSGTSFVGAHTGNGAGLTNLAASALRSNALPFVTVGPVANDGSMFNPGTVGTTTAGIQEAWDSLYQTNGFGEIIGGGRVVAGPGTYVFTSQLKIRQTYPYAFVFEGAGESTRLLDAIPSATHGIVNVTSNTVNSGNSLNITLKNFIIARAWPYDTNKDALIRLYGANEGTIDNVIFVTEQSMHSNAYGAPLVYYSGVPTNKVGTIGLWVDSGANRMTLKKPRFFGLACGAILGGDHTFIDEPLFGNIGHYFVNGSLSASIGTAWTAIPTAPGAPATAELTNILSQGAALIGYKNTYDFNVHNGQWFECHIAWVNDGNGFGPLMSFLNPFIELGCEYRNVITVDENGDDFGHSAAFTIGARQRSPDAFLYVTNGSIALTTPGQESTFHEAILGDDGTEALQVFVNKGFNGRSNLFDLTTDGDLTIPGKYIGNGASITNIHGDNVNTVYSTGLSAVTNAGKVTVALAALGVAYPLALTNGGTQVWSNGGPVTASAFTNRASAGTKVQITDANGKLTDAILSGLSLSGTTLTASGGGAGSDTTAWHNGGDSGYGSTATIGTTDGKGIYIKANSQEGAFFTNNNTTLVSAAIASPGANLGTGQNGVAIASPSAAMAGSGSENVTLGTSVATITAGSSFSAVIASSTSTAGGNGQVESVVIGGENATATSSYGFSTGRRAKNSGVGAKVFADSQNSDFTVTEDDTFNVRAQSGIRLWGPTIVNSNGVPHATNAFQVAVPTNRKAFEVDTNGVTRASGGFSANTITNLASAGTKVQITDANGKLTDAILSGLSLSGTTLTASGSTPTPNLTQFDTYGTNLIAGVNVTNLGSQGITETNWATKSYTTLSNAAFLSTNGTALNGGTTWGSNTPSAGLAYWGTNPPSAGRGTAIVNGFLGGTNVWEFDYPGGVSIGGHSNGAVFIGPMGLTNNGNQKIAGTLHILGQTTSAGIAMGGNILSQFALRQLTKTANYSISQFIDAGTTINNTGAAVAITNTLPSANIAGLGYSFYVDAAQILCVQAVGSDTIRYRTTVSAAAGNIFANAAGSYLHVFCLKSGAWIVDNISASADWTGPQ